MTKPKADTAKSSLPPKNPKPKSKLAVTTAGSSKAVAGPVRRAKREYKEELEEKAKEAKAKKERGVNPPIKVVHLPPLVPEPAPVSSNPKHVRIPSRWKFAWSKYEDSKIGPHERPALPNIKANHTYEIRWFDKTFGPLPEMFEWAPKEIFADVEAGVPDEYVGGCPGCGLASMCTGPTSCGQIQRNRWGQIVAHPSVYVDRSTYTPCPYKKGLKTLPYGEPINEPKSKVCRCCKGDIDPRRQGRRPR
jgi:hypothetical protein